MANTNITKIKSRWILDSRGNPTVETDVFCEDKWARAIVPSGASTGEAEALELRDGGKAFLGKGVMKAVQNVNDILGSKLLNFDVMDQEKLDTEMNTIDGTENKGNLGANAILSVSMAAARLAAKLSNKPLYHYLYETAYKKTTEKVKKKHVVKADPEHLRYAIQNVLENAIRYSDESSPITLDIKKDKEYTTFSCSNTGIGIPEDMQKFIFAKFFRGKNAMAKKSEGTGLGMYVTKELLRLNRAEIWFESKESKTTFFIKLKNA